MEWIKIEDELPREAGYYLVISEWGPVEKAEFNGMNYWNYPFGDPTHWMPLPKAPK